MRPQQQNRRMRGRNNNGGSGGNNNRKNPNPLTRNYESNGPDVKIRGSAQQIAEKYAALARDAMSSGDRVMAENYLQHAEHYNRIIAAAQAQMPIQNVQSNRDDFEEDGDEERDDFDRGSNGNVADAPVSQTNYGSGPQPVIEGTPAEVALGSEAGESGGNREAAGRQRDRRQNGQPRGEQLPRNGQRGEEVRRDAEPAAPAPAVQDLSEAEPATPTESLSPAELAARAEANEAAAPRRPRRPRRPRAGADGSVEAIAPAETTGAEPVPSEG